MAYTVKISNRFKKQFRRANFKVSGSATSSLTG